MPASVHSQEPQEADQSMIDAEPEVDPIMLEEKRVVVVRYPHSNGGTERELRTSSLDFDLGLAVCFALLRLKLFGIVTN
jgi:hypothetical protein